MFVQNILLFAKQCERGATSDATSDATEQQSTHSTPWHQSLCLSFACVCFHNGGGVGEWVSEPASESAQSGWQRRNIDPF